MNLRRTAKALFLSHLWPKTFHHRRILNLISTAKELFEIPAMLNKWDEISFICGKMVSITSHNISFAAWTPNRSILVISASGYGRKRTLHTETAIKDINIPISRWHRCDAYYYAIVGSCIVLVVSDSYFVSPVVSCFYFAIFLWKVPETFYGFEN